VSAALVLAVCLAGCGKHGSPLGGDDRPPARVNLRRNVELGRAEQRSLVYHVETVGVLEAEGHTFIAAGVAGVVDEVLFREGDVVDRNSILVKVDQRKYEAALRVAEAQEKRALAQLALAKDLASRATAAGIGVSAEERSKYLLNLNVAEAELLSARAALELARNNFDRSQVRAPYRGQINQRRVTPGTYLEEATVIATMADLSRIRLVGWVPETAAPTVRRLMAEQPARLRAVKATLPLCGFGPSPWAALGCAAGIGLADSDQVPSGFDPEFTLQAYRNRTFRARCFYLSKVADPSTHMFECKAEIDTRGLDVDLEPGYTARIRIPLESNPAACVVPEEAIRASERGFIVFVPTQRLGRDGSLEWVSKARTLELGYRAPGWVEVLYGLQPGEWIVRRGAEALEDGTPIHFGQWPTPTDR
jgi:multidrug efflux system membrane fusion protein